LKKDDLSHVLLSQVVLWNAGIQRK
jgi:hypothetical protein